MKEKRSLNKDVNTSEPVIDKRNITYNINVPFMFTRVVKCFWLENVMGCIINTPKALQRLTAQAFSDTI